MPRRVVLWCAPFLLSVPAFLVLAVPTEVQQPGTQPGEVSNLGAVSHCDNCHGGYDPVVEPAFNWRGSMMAHAARDPLFWAAVAIAEQDFPGAGDLCLRCHTPRAWLEGRSTPTDGSGLTSADVDGAECAICHKMVNPDDSEHLGVQSAPFLAHNEATTATGYYGSGMLVMWDGNERIGPYGEPFYARHAVLQSRFHRSEDFCGTCHDVSNPVIGDLAPGNGTQVPLAPGTFSGQLGSPVETKAAFQNFPFAYGTIERTYSEHKASLWPATRVSDYDLLPPELQGGAVRSAYQSAVATGRGGDYEDGTTRFFTCQTCHMPPVTGRGCNKRNSPERGDLPLHDLTGGNYWMPEVIEYLDARSRLRVGGGLSTQQLAALDGGRQRAMQQLENAAALSVSGDTVRVVNLTGHKLISGYPEGRRMWLRIRWHDALANVLREDGAYGEITATVGGTPTRIRTLLDLSGTNTRIYEAKPGITQEWASRLLGLGVPASLPLSYDRAAGTVGMTLGQLAAAAAGATHESFHFVLNNTLISDTRIPPWGMSYNEARRRSTLPVPEQQYGDPGAGGTYEHWDDLSLNPPTGAVFATVELSYQPTSWEYVQFLHLANNKQNPFLAQVGDDLLEAWLNTGMAEPHVMASAIWCRLPGTGEDLELRSQVNGSGDPLACSKTAEAGARISVSARSPSGTFLGSLSALLLQFYPSGQPPVALPFLPSVWLNQVHAQVVVPALPPIGVAVGFAIPSGVAGITMRAQAVALSPSAANGEYAATDAHDVLLQ